MGLASGAPRGELPQMTTPNTDIKWLSGQFPQLSDLKPLSSGGQKLVFSASHADHGAVVLKLIYPGQGSSTVALEMQAVDKVNSERVPRIFDDGRLQTQVRECLWLIEQQVAGKSLRERLQAGPLDANVLLRLGRQMLEALVAAEDVQIVHRDVKPDNIMVDDESNFWLLDFGIARHLELPTRTPDGALFGKYTPGYAPPEQFRNLKPKIDSRSDLFALGVTLYECAKGKNPFREGARDEVEVLKRVEGPPLPRLKFKFPGADSFADLICAMTQKRRDHRPESAKEVLTWIQELGEGGE